MADEQTIRFILGTYELPEKLKNKLAWIAEQRLEEMFIDGFDEQYTYIAQLVDDFTKPYNLRFIKSLDAIVSFQDSRTYHEVVGSRSSRIEETQTQSPSQNEFQMCSILDVLKLELKKPHYDFVHYLVRHAKNVKADPREVSENIEEIKIRVSQLAGKYQANGKVIMPKRPIKKISFDPLHIVFKKRRYGGNPLGFFNKHRDTYDGMTRTRLSVFDPGLYRALCRSDQIHLAIP